MKITDSYIRDLVCTYYGTNYHLRFDLVDSDTDSTNMIIILLSFLHKQGAINKARLKAMFKNLKQGKLLRTINTYHCTITDKWYNNQHMFSILCDVYLSRSVKEEDKEMSVDEFLSYLNLYYNANKNYCVNSLALNYIVPLLTRILEWDGYANKVLKDWELILPNTDYSFERVRDSGIWELSFGYCCEDCDGDVERYEYYRWRDRVKYENDSLITDIKNKLKELKTHDKNPNDFLKNLTINIQILEQYY